MQNQRQINIDEVSEESEKKNVQMWINTTLSVLTFLVTVAGIVAAVTQLKIANETLELTSEPKLLILPINNIHINDSSASLQIKNQSIGDLVNIDIFKNIIGVYGSFENNDYFVCPDYVDQEQQPFSRIPNLKSLTQLPVKVDIRNKCDTKVCLLRIRVDYERKVDKLKKTQYMTYYIDDTNNVEMQLLRANTQMIASSMNNKNNKVFNPLGEHVVASTMERVNIINLVENFELRTVDDRCSFKVNDPGIFIAVPEFR